MGIYGDEAVGLQEVDFEGKTVQFDLCFKANDVRQAEQRWHQLLLYAKPLQDIMEVSVK